MRMDTFIDVYNMNTNICLYLWNRYEILYQEESKKSREVLRPLELELQDLSDQVQNHIKRGYFKKWGKIIWCL